MGPLDPGMLAGTVWNGLLYLVIGMGFGAVLEMAGFGDSRKLAAQFYFREMTVLKVMFTAIVTAMLLVFGASSLHLLDFSKVWVNPTYLWPGIFGGLIMGVGFVIGGFCPGTSMVAASTLKIDGIAFVLGGLFGAFAFGESVGSFDQFFNSSYMGRFTLPEWLGLPYGATVVLIVLMAVVMFRAAEWIEERGAAKRRDGSYVPSRRFHKAGAAALVLAGAFIAVKGQPTVQDRWRWIEAAEGRLIEERKPYVHPAEVVELRGDVSLYVDVMDLRSESDFNLFHIADARRVTRDELNSAWFVKGLLAAPDNHIHFLVSNGEGASTEAYKILKSQGVLNLYIIEGGINNWLALYPLNECIAARDEGAAGRPDALGYSFKYAIGSRNRSSHPERLIAEPFPECAVNDGGKFPAPPAHEKKVRLRKKGAEKRGCG